MIFLRVISVTTLSFLLLLTTGLSNGGDCGQCALCLVTGLAVIGFAIIPCWVNECCSDSWISTDFTGLHEDLSKRLYGQHLVIEPLVKHMKAHAKQNPSKALALSFHGWTGTGKNYASSIVAKHMYRKGMESKYVHLISATRDFKHAHLVPQYKDYLRDLIENAVKECPRSLFIFDEMDKMPAGLIDTIKPYLDYYDSLRGVNYRHATFLFLSDTAGNEIAEHTLKHWVDGNDREKITLKEMEQVIQLPALNAKSGLWHSELITKHLITAYLPFLPLERHHVKQCIKYGLVQKGYYQSVHTVPVKKVQEIADELSYYPVGVNVFSTTGCKRVSDKIDLIMMEDL